MQQSRLEKFFTLKKSNSTGSTTATTSNNTIEQSSQNETSKKRSSNNEETNTKKLKRNNSDLLDENHFSLNQFYLKQFQTILSTLLEHHKDLFIEHELKLFETFQTLSSKFSF